MCKVIFMVNPTVVLRLGLGWGFDKKVCENCTVCQRLKKSQSKPKVALPKVTDFNQVVTLDLKQFEGKNVLWAIDSYTGFIQGVVINYKKA